MTIKTLEHIHKLLIEEERRSYEAYKAVRDMQHNYEEHGSPESQAMAKDKEAQAKELWETHMAAYDARQEFEDKDW